MLQSGDKAMVLCFVEFDDSKCALTAMEALQGNFFFEYITEFDVPPHGPEESINITLTL